MVLCVDSEHELSLLIGLECGRNDHVFASVQIVSKKHRPGVGVHRRDCFGLDGVKAVFTVVLDTHHVEADGQVFLVHESEIQLVQVDEHFVGLFGVYFENVLRIIQERRIVDAASTLMRLGPFAKCDAFCPRFSDGEQRRIDYAADGHLVEVMQKVVELHPLTPKMETLQAMVNR